MYVVDTAKVRWCCRHPTPPGCVVDVYWPSVGVPGCVVDVYWPSVGVRRRHSQGPLVLSASHTSSVAEQLVSVVAAMQSLTHSRHVVSELITDQLDSITRLLSSPASLLLLPPHVSMPVLHI